jgi:hypothetical protein
MTAVPGGLRDAYVCPSAKRCLGQGRPRSDAEVMKEGSACRSAGPRSRGRQLSRSWVLDSPVSGSVVFGRGPVAPTRCRGGPDGTLRSDPRQDFLEERILCARSMSWIGCGTPCRSAADSSRPGLREGQMERRLPSRRRAHRRAPDHRRLQPAAVGQFSHSGTGHSAPGPRQGCSQGPGHERYIQAMARHRGGLAGNRGADPFTGDAKQSRR